MPRIELPAGGVLRALREDDVAPYVQAFRDDPAIGVQLGLDDDPDEGRLHDRVARLPGLLEEGRFAELAIGEPFAGSLTLHSLDWKNRRGEIGFFVVPEARRRGVATGAVAAALEWAFRDLDLDRVEMTTTPDNTAVAALAARLGFVREGVLRARNLERGRRVDVVWFGLLRDEWSSAYRAS